MSRHPKTSDKSELESPNDKPRKLPRSFKELTPCNHFNPRKFFHEMVWKALLTKRHGTHREPKFPKLQHGEVAITWIGHASFLVQHTDLNILIDPNFANWLFLLKRIAATAGLCSSIRGGRFITLATAPTSRASRRLASVARQRSPCCRSAPTIRSPFARRTWGRTTR